MRHSSYRKLSRRVLRWGASTGLFAAATMASSVAFAGRGNPVGFAGTAITGVPLNTVIYVDPLTLHIDVLSLSPSGWTAPVDLFTNLYFTTQTQSQLMVNAEFANVSPFLWTSTTTLPFVGADGNVYEMGEYLVPGLDTPPGALTPTSNVSGYERSDGVATIDFTGDGDLVEVELGEKNPTSSDLTVMKGAPPAYTWNVEGVGTLSADPFGYVRTDGVNAIVYVGWDSNIREESLSGGTWGSGNLTQLSGSVVPADPRSPIWAYARNDGVNSVVFLGNDNHIHEIYLSPTGWRSGDLSVQSGDYAGISPPVAYARGDGTNSVLSLDTNGDIHEYYLSPGASHWQAANLTQNLHAIAVQTNTLPNFAPAFSVSGYVRTDNVNAVVYRGINGHIVEMSLAPGGAWAVNNLL